MHTTGAAPPRPSDAQRRGFSPRNAWPIALVVLIALGAAWSGLANGFAYDDVAIIAENPRVHTLARWWEHLGATYWPPQFGASLYRPLTTLAYAFEWSVTGGTPFGFHAVNVALYAAVSVAVFLLLRRLVGWKAAVVGAALFAAHPVHTEAVANVVGQAELLAALAVITALQLYLRARAGGGPRLGQGLAIGALYLAGSLTKEHALLLPALLAAAEWLVVEDTAPLRERVGRVWPLYAALVVVASSVLAARTIVIGSLLGERSVVEMDAPTRLWTMFRVIPEWVRLFIWPAHLSAEYGPRQIDVTAGASGLALLGIALLCLAVLAFAAAIRAPRPRVAAFAIAWLAVTLLPASNLVTGLVLEERTLFLPSVAIVLLAALAFVRVGDGVSRVRGRRAAALAPGLAAALVLLGVWRSADRNPAWRDNLTLFAQTATDAPRSYRAHYVYGRTLFELGRSADGERELRAAIDLADNDADPFNYLATKYREAEQYALAIQLYRQALGINPRRPDARFGLALSLLETGDSRGARREAEEGIRGGQLRSYFDWILTRADSLDRAAKSGSE